MGTYNECPVNVLQDFRSIMEIERDILNDLVGKWNNVVVNEADISDETRGLVMSAIGKTRLLTNEKFNQFEKLLENSEMKRAETNISLNDLQGYWDYITIQVNELKEAFGKLEILKNAPFIQQKASHKETVAVLKKHNGTIEDKTTIPSMDAFKVGDTVAQNAEMVKLSDKRDDENLSECLETKLKLDDINNCPGNNIDFS